MIMIVSLCPACTNCPTVEVGDDAIRIGESENRVTLTPEEWNVLVRAIKAGELDEVKYEEEVSAPTLSPRGAWRSRVGTLGSLTPWASRISVYLFHRVCIIQDEWADP